MSKADDIYRENVYGLFEYAKELEAALEAAGEIEVCLAKAEIALADMQERCAKVCEDFGKTLDDDIRFFGEAFAEEVRALDKEK